MEPENQEPAPGEIEADVPAPPRRSKGWRIIRSALWLCLFLVLSAATRCANYENVFIDGKIYFVDADCYSRMTRVREVLGHPGTIVRHHEFENFPQGTDPHTTAPMDYLIAGLALLLRPFTSDHVDLAGALISPLLGLLTTAFLWYWSRELVQRYRKPMLLLVALSPIIVRGTTLGRPDHQSLLILLIAVALGAELAMARTPSKEWSIIAGVAWALALWTSLYEPLILMTTILGAKLIFFRPQLLARERMTGNLIFVGVLGLALLAEGGHVITGFLEALPFGSFGATDETTEHYLAQWFQTVGEMSPIWRLSPGGVFRSLLFSWVGFGLLVAPLLLIARLRDAKRSVLLLVLLVVTFILAVAQARWGYFFALVFAMSLPWQLSLFKKPWLVWSLFLLSLWPVLRDWDQRLFPNEERVARLAQFRFDRAMLRDAAVHLRSEQKLPVLAPWWLSPLLVYWSGQPAIAGSSHESLGGIVDSARFYSDTDMAVAATILDRRGVRAVIGCEPTEIAANSAALLFKPLPDDTVAEMLWVRPHSVPPPLRVVYANPAYKVFLVDPPPAP